MCTVGILEIYNEGCEHFIYKINNSKKKSKWSTNGITCGYMRKILNVWHANKRSRLNKTDL